MSRIALFGAGQAGAMAARMTGAGHSVCCVADNDAEKRGGALGGAPVVSPEDALAMEPDCFCLCVLDSVRAEEMERQLRELGYAGPVMRLDALRLFDARSGVMRLLAEQLNAHGTEGDAAELGVYRGDFAAQINAAFPRRRLHLFDTFEGFPQEDVETERRYGLSAARAGDFAGTTEELVRSRLPHGEMAVFHRGYFPDTFRECLDCRFAFVSIDADLYAPTSAALPLFWDRLAPGGVLLVHDVNGTQYAGAGRAVDEFCRERALLPVPVCDLHGSVVLRKTWTCI